MNPTQNSTPNTHPPAPFAAVMIDIETLDTHPGSIVHEIAAVEFCPDTFETGRQIGLKICPLLSTIVQLTIDEATEQWHKAKGHMPPPTYHEDPSVRGPISALKKLNDFIQKINPKQFWCRGVSFDFPLLEAVYRACNMEETTPWKYYQQYDVRTIWNLAFQGEKPPEADHTALVDCHAQIEQLAAANDRIIDTCNNQLTDRQLLDITRKRGSDMLIYGLHFHKCLIRHNPQPSYPPRPPSNDAAAQAHGNSYSMPTPQS